MTPVSIDSDGIQRKTPYTCRIGADGGAGERGGGSHGLEPRTDGGRLRDDWNTNLKAWAAARLHHCDALLGRVEDVEQLHLQEHELAKTYHHMAERLTVQTLPAAVGRDRFIRSRIVEVAHLATTVGERRAFALEVTDATDAQLGEAKEEEWRSLVKPVFALHTHLCTSSAYPKRS